MGPPRLDLGVPFAVAAAIGVVLTVVAALVCNRGKKGAAVGLGLGVVAVSLPLAIDVDPPILRVITGMIGGMCVLRVIDIVRGATRLEEASRRVWFATTPFDVRQTSRVPPGIDGVLIARVLGFAALATAAGFGIVTLAPRLGSASMPIRWVLGAALVYSIVDATTAAIALGYRIGGVRTPDFHRAPVLSRTLQEFWSERWNRPVHEWLQRHCFMPLARRGHVAAGVLAAFVVSTLLHVYLAFVAVELTLALLMGAFFVAQGGLLLAERALRVARWPSMLARAWTISCFSLTGPLFVEPMLVILEL